MAVVTRYTAGYPQQTPAAGFGFQNNNWLEAKANARAATFNVAATNGDSINSVYKLARLPSTAIIMPSTLFCPAIAGATSVSLGLSSPSGSASAACLMSAVNISAGGAFSMISAVTIANYNQRLWQIMGLTSDPNAMLDVNLTLNAALTASGAIAGWINYLPPAI